MNMQILTLDCFYYCVCSPSDELEDKSFAIHVGNKERNMVFSKWDSLLGAYRPEYSNRDKGSTWEADPHCS